MHGAHAYSIKGDAVNEITVLKKARIKSVMPLYIQSLVLKCLIYSLDFRIKSVMRNAAAIIIIVLQPNVGQTMRKLIKNFSMSNARQQMFWTRKVKINFEIFKILSF